MIPVERTLDPPSEINRPHHPCIIILLPWTIMNKTYLCVSKWKYQPYEEQRMHLMGYGSTRNHNFFWLRVSYIWFLNGKPYIFLGETISIETLRNWGLILKFQVWKIQASKKKLLRTAWCILKVEKSINQTFFKTPRLPLQDSCETFFFCLLALRFVLLWDPSERPKNLTYFVTPYQKKSWIRLRRIPKTTISNIPSASETTNKINLLSDLT